MQSCLRLDASTVRNIFTDLGFTIDNWGSHNLKLITQDIRPLGNVLSVVGPEDKPGVYNNLCTITSGTFILRLNGLNAYNPHPPGIVVCNHSLQCFNVISVQGARNLSPLMCYSHGHNLYAVDRIEVTLATSVRQLNKINMMDAITGLSIFNVRAGLNVIVLVQAYFLLYSIIAKDALGQPGQESHALEGAKRVTKCATRVIAMVHQYAGRSAITDDRE